jgi:hypothetical protein
MQTTKKTVITMPMDFAIKNGLNEPKNFKGDFSYNGKTFRNMKVLKAWGHKTPTFNNVSFEIEYAV